MSDAPPRYQRHPEALHRQLEDGVLLLAGRGDQDQPVFVEGTGSVLWELLADPWSLDELVAALAEAYGADPAEVAAGVAPVLDQLVDEGVVTRLP